MGIKISAENGRVPVAIMHMDGNMDSSIYEAFQSSAQELIRGGTTYILVDLSNVAFVGSAGSRALHSILSQLRLLHPDISEQEIRKGINAGTYKSPYLKLLNPFREVQSILSIGGFEMYIEIHTDLKTTIASF